MRYIRLWGLSEEEFLMANISFTDRQKIQSLFECVNGKGYVLDFTNPMFQEFVYEILELDIYKKYSGMSKGKILNAIMQEYNDTTVGKFLLELMNYMQSKSMVTDNNRADFERCVDIANKLIGKSATTKPKTSETPPQPNTSSVDYELLSRNLQKLTNYDDTAQARGFAFERYLKELFESFYLQPRGSFKLIGEQIDGSFTLHNEVYLLEAKWTSKAIDKAQLVVFNEKVSSKSGFTRGVYISFAGYSSEALETFPHGRTINIILLTVQELAIGLSRRLDLKELLWAKVRALAEEGNCNKSIFEI